MSEEFHLTAEQKIVVDSMDSRIAIVAAAGAGKTRVLVERYLKHVLQEKIDPDRILTITFTRKAAAEMKERIVAGLRKVGALDEAQIAETGPIQTIHALCEQILRENAILAGLDAKFEILSESQSMQAQIEVIEEAIATMDTDAPEAEQLIASLAGRRSYGGISPYSLLKSSLLSALDGFRGSGADRRSLAGVYSSPVEFRRYWQQTLLGEQPPAVLEKFEIQENQDWREGLKASYKAARIAVPGWLRSIPDQDEDRELERSTCGIAQIVLEAWALLEARMERSQVFDFNDLEALTVRLLQANPPLQAALRQRFEIVMIDEAQDLNQNQYRLLDLLQAGRVLTVGDGQQSIYGFRHADLDRFLQTHSSDAKRLTKNWRSQKGILNFVDRIFQSTWGERYFPMVETGFDLDDLAPEDFSGVELWEIPAYKMETTASYIGRLIDEGADPGHICVLARDSRTCQVIHEALEHEGIESRIHGGSEKFYTRMEVRDLANTLRALAEPYHDFSLLALLRGPAVGLSVDGLVRLGLKRPVIDHLDDAELGGEDQAKVGAFRQWFDPLRAYADRLSAWEVLSEVFAATPFLSAIAENENGAQQVANVRKLLVLAGQDAHLGPLEFAEQIREIQALKHKEGDAEHARDSARLVRLMTIHKSKGLEFPIVVIPDTNKKLAQSSSEVLYDARLRLLSARFGKGKGLLHSFLEFRKRERELAEELRVLYVAMTRAQNRLCIALHPTTSHDTLSRRIRKIVGDPPPESIRVRVPIEMA